MRIDTNAQHPASLKKKSDTTDQIPLLTLDQDKENYLEFADKTRSVRIVIIWR
jgi:hypothetical protein